MLLALSQRFYLLNLYRVYKWIKTIMIVASLCLLFSPNGALAIEDAEEESSSNRVDDPFADYSEFENPISEQRDILFFKTSRFITIGGFFGGRIILGEERMYTGDWIGFGFFVGYFLTLETSIQFSFLRSDHPSAFGGSDGSQRRFITDYTTFSLGIKYYVNTDRLIKPISFFNPYFIASGVYGIKGHRGILEPDESPNQSDRVIKLETPSSAGAKFGGGIEIRILKYLQLGLQVDFAYIPFGDEGTITTPTLGDEDGSSKQEIYTATGDFLNVFTFISFNF